MSNFVAEFENYYDLETGNIKIESKREQSKASFQNAEHEQSRRNVKIVRGVFDTKLELNF